MENHMWFFTNQTRTEKFSHPYVAKAIKIGQEY